MPHHRRDHTEKHPVWSGDRGQGAGELCARAFIMVSSGRNRWGIRPSQQGYLCLHSLMLPSHTPLALLHFHFFSGTYYLLYNLLIMLIVCHHPLIPCTFHKSRNLSVSSSLMYTKNSSEGLEPQSRCLVNICWVNEWLADTHTITWVLFHPHSCSRAGTCWITDKTVKNWD